MRRFKVYPFLAFLLLSACSSGPKVTYQEDGGRFPANFQTCFQTMNSVVNYQYLETASDLLLTKAKNLKELESSYGRESLIDLQRRLDDKTIKEANIQVQKLLTGALDSKKINGKTHFVTM